MYAYGIGLDIGITSVGWAILGLDKDEHPCGIVDFGSRIFDAAEHPKTGASLAAPRREKRSMRRRLRRHHHRIERIRGMIVSSGLLTESQLEHLFDGKLEDIYAIRVRALDQKVTEEEFARILIHLAQRRGFRSNRKEGTVAQEGQLLKAVGENLQRMEENGYRTVGEMLLRDPQFSECKRNKGESYLTTVSRALIEDEAKQIFSAQREFGNAFAKEDFEEQYLKILLAQRSFDEGPGGNSPYGGDMIEKMVGKCTFEEEEKRAAKATYSFEYFNLLTKVNHLRIVEGGKSIELTREQRKIVIDLAHRTENLHYLKLREKLGLTDSQTFADVFYKNDVPKEESEKKTKFCFLKAYHQIRKALDKVKKGYIEELTLAQRNAIGTALTYYRTDEKICTYLKDYGVAEEIFENILGIGNFTKFGHLSEKACNKIIPYLEAGKIYNEACADAGYDFKAHGNDEKTLYLKLKEEDMESITSPVAKRAISQTVKVINAIIRSQGNVSPTFINIELAREMAKDFTERKKIEKQNKENQGFNEQIKEEIICEFGKKRPNGQDIIKLKLFHEQAERCMYSQKPIKRELLFDPGYVEIDHIVPYSISFDDRMCNKVLVLAKENREKGNRLPLEYLAGKRRDDYIVWVESTVRDFRKRQLLLKEHITDNDRKGFRERNLQDTKTISRFMMNFINDNLKFAESDHRKKRVTAVNGAVTSYLRKRWGIMKIRENGDLHHAVDAVVIGCATDGMIRQISRYSEWRECQYIPGAESAMAVDPYTGEILREFPYPWPKFRVELDARMSGNPDKYIASLELPFYEENEITVRKPFVSRMSKHKVTGAAHKDTAKSLRTVGDGKQVAVVKTDLSKLKLDKNGEIENYYDPNSDRLLYNALKERLIAFGGKGEKAFEGDFRKPKSDGTPGPVVKKVKVYEPTTLNVPVYKGKAVADNDSMVRVDVFYVENDGYYLVPIYVADTLKAELPNKACVAGKSYSEWKEMKDDDFIFSLYPNDLICVTHKNKITLTKNNKDSILPEKYSKKTEFLYYKKMGIANAVITAISHDSSYIVESLGVKSLVSLEKYTVDVLGYYHKEKHSKRKPFCLKK